MMLMMAASTGAQSARSPRAAVTIGLVHGALIDGSSWRGVYDGRIHGALANPNIGRPREPPVFMQPGDIFEVEIEGMGVLRNPVQDG